MDTNNNEVVLQRSPLMEQSGIEEREIQDDGNPSVVSKNKRNPAPSSPAIKPSPKQTYPEPYSIQPPSSSTDESLDKDKQPAPSKEVSHPRLYPAPTDNSFWHRVLYPTGVTPRHRKYEHWVGRVGFGAKALVYGFVGGMTCASASRLSEEQNGSPQGAFILIGDFPGGVGLLIVMLIALMCYVAWRWWEFFTFQGADATFSPFKNFFAYRLSPLVSGCVYVAYGYYIIEVLADNAEPSCYPECWRHSTIGKIGLVLFGIAFAIACLTQLLNTFTKKWHPEIDWHKCRTKFEKYLLLTLGHLGFLGRSGLFLFVSILMFRALREPVRQGGATIANGVNQFIGTGAGRVFMFIFGALTLLYGVFALACTRYRFFPTPPPSGIPLYYRHADAEARNAKLGKGEGDMVQMEMEQVEKGERAEAL